MSGAMSARGVEHVLAGLSAAHGDRGQAAPAPVRLVRGMGLGRPDGKPLFGKDLSGADNGVQPRREAGEDRYHVDNLDDLLRRKPGGQTGLDMESQLRRGVAQSGQGGDGGRLA